MSRWVVEISNWHPARINQWDGCHWSVRSKLKKSDRELVARYARGIPPATGKRRVSFTLTLAPRQRGADPDAYWKSLNDALVQCGALKDDNRQWLELGVVKYARGASRATTIIIEDIQNHG